MGVSSRGMYMCNIAGITPKWKDIRIAGITPNRDDICSICSTADILELYVIVSKRLKR